MARPSGGITAVKPPICLMNPKLQNDTGKRGYTNRIFPRGEAVPVRRDDSVRQIQVERQGVWKYARDQRIVEPVQALEKAAE